LKPGFNQLSGFDPDLNYAGFDPDWTISKVASVRWRKGDFL